MYGVCKKDISIIISYFIHKINLAIIYNELCIIFILGKFNVYHVKFKYIYLKIVTTL